MSLETLSDIFKRPLQDMEALFSSFNQAGPGQSKDLAEAMDYAFFSGGKRVRPLLSLSSLEAFEGDYQDLVPFIAALEAIHSYSLVHDDLPAMDDDDYRRGQPSVHKKYGEGLGILVGDGLLNLAAELAFYGAGALDGKKRARGLEAGAYLFKMSGTRGMVDGQALDISGQGERALLYREKTGSLVSAALAMGGILGGASPGEVQALKEAGFLLGVSYQIKDDILDLDEEDVWEGASAQDLQAQVQAYSDEAWGLVSGLGRDFSDLRTLMEVLLDREL